MKGEALFHSLVSIDASPGDNNSFMLSRAEQSRQESSFSRNYKKERSDLIFMLTEMGNNW